MKKIISIIMAASLFMGAAFAKTVTFNIGGETVTFSDDGTGTTTKIPKDMLLIIEQNQREIQQAITDYNSENSSNPITADAIKSVAPEINTAWQEFEQNMGGSATPVSDITDGLNGFSGALARTIPNTQLQQQVYAEAWIGKLIPGCHFGLGINPGLATLDLTSLIQVANALDIDVSDVTSNLKDNKFIFPTLAFDARIGGIVLPFDVGISFCKINTADFESIVDFGPLAADFYTFGIDGRYALINGHGIFPKVSVGAGYTITKGSFQINDDTAKAFLDFKSQTMYLSAQASIKLLFVTPFVGARVFTSATSVDWGVKDIDWNGIYGSSNADLSTQAASVLLPKHFEGGASTKMFDSINPQLFGGVGIDLFVLSLTTGVSYDIKDDILGATVNLRISW